MRRSGSVGSAGPECPGGDEGSSEPKSVPVGLGWLPGGLLLQYAEFLADLGEGGNASVEVLLLVAGGYLYTDTSLVFRHYRVVESGYEYAFVLQACSHLLGQLGVVA